MASLGTSQRAAMYLVGHGGLPPFFCCEVRLHVNSCRHLGHPPSGGGPLPERPDQVYVPGEKIQNFFTHAKWAVSLKERVFVITEVQASKRKGGLRDEQRSQDNMR